MTTKEVAVSDLEPVELGAAMRRKILGDAYGKRLETMAEGDAKSGDTALLTSTFTTLAAEHLWAATWPREGLDERSRRIATIGVLIALASKEELELHLDAAIEKDQLSKDEIKEIVLHATSYVGYPLALSALKQFSGQD